MQINRHFGVNAYLNQKNIKKPNPLNSQNKTDTKEKTGFISNENNNSDFKKDPAKSQLEDKALDGKKELSDQQKLEVQKLKNRDSEVKAHEQAHLSAAGGIAIGRASYSYQSGPDGNRYAVGGEVSIDTSEESTPQATIQKMRRVRAAALAPASPSSTDRAVASMATQKMIQAQRQSNMEDSESSESLNSNESGKAEKNNKESGKESAKNGYQNKEPDFRQKKASDAYKKIESDFNRSIA